MQKTIAILFLFISYCGFSQTNGDYRTSGGGSGDWSDANSWQRYQGATWQAAATGPSRNDGRITILAGHSITLTTSVQVNEFYINGTLTISPTGTLITVAGTGDEVTIESATGLLTVQGIFTQGSSTSVINTFGADRIVYSAGSTHNYLISNAGVFFPSTWDPTATLNLSGFNLNAGTTYLLNSSWNQSFGNININSDNHRGIVDFGGNLQTIQGNLVINLVNGGTVRFANGQALNLSIGTLNSAVGGNLTVSGTARVIFTQTGSGTVNIYNDFTFNSSNASYSYLTNTGNTVMNVYGNASMAAGTGRIRLTNTGTTGLGTINFYKNFTLTSGIIEVVGTGATNGNLNFVGTGNQTFTNSNAVALPVTGRVNWYIAPTSTLDVGTSWITGAITGNVLTSATFTLGGTIRLGSLDGTGAIDATGAAGNIRISPTLRTYQPASTIVYAGAGLQFLGSGHPVNTDVNTTIDNVSGVQLISDATIGGPLALLNGNLDLNGFILTTTGTITPTNGSFAGTPASTLILQCPNAGSIGSIPFANGLNNLNVLTVNLTGAGASITSPSALNIASNLNLLAGDLISNGVITMASASLVTRYETGSLSVNEVTTLPGETYNLYYTSFNPGAVPLTVFPSLELSSDPAKLGDLTLNFAVSTDILELNRAMTINGTTILENGNLSQSTYNITMNGAQWIHNAGGFIGGAGTLFFNGNTVVDGNGVPTFGNVQVNSAMTVTFNKDFSIGGSVTIQTGGTFDMADFVMSLIESNAQVINANGASLSNIYVEKSGGSVSISSVLNLTGRIEFANTTSNINVSSGGFLRLISTSDAAGSGTAYIGQLINGNSVSGNVEVQRFMSGEGRIYRYLSSPISTGTVADLKDDFSLTGPFADPSPSEVICGFRTNSTSSSMFLYNEAVAGDVQNGYVGYPSSGTAASNPLEVGRGYAAFIRQCSVPTTIDFTGPINSGSISLPVTYNSSGDAVGDGWNLVGNPYPCVIGWDAGDWIKSGISSSIAITDNSSGTPFLRYYDPGLADDDFDGLIAIGQGFWTRATGPGAQLTVAETSKVSTVSEFFRTAPIPGIKMAISSGNKRDYLYIKTVADAKPALDDFDAPKIANPTPMFSASTVAEGNIAMAINAIQSLSCGDEFALKTSGLTEGRYTVKLDKRGFFNHLQFVLVDKFAQVEKVLDAGEFSFNVTGDAGSKSVDRFLLKVEENKNLPAPEVLSAEACKEVASVSLATTLQDVSYSVWNKSGEKLSEFTTGTGQAMNIAIPAALLVEGENELEVKAGGVCNNALAVSTSFILNKKVPTVVAQNIFNCKSGSVILAATSNEIHATINWYERENDVIPVYSGNDFETPVSAKNQTYFVEAVSATGCSSDRKPVTTEIYVFTPPTLEVSGAKLVATGETGNHTWYYEGLPIGQANASSVNLVRTGSYELVTNIKGCEFKLQYEYDDIDFGIEVYPNPVVEKLTLTRISDSIDKVVLINTNGQNLNVVYQKGGAFNGTFDMENLPEGVYMLQITRSGQQHSVRIVKSTE